MVNPNPIQQVLQAEREADAEVENARKAADQSVAAARRWAQEWTKRAEARLQSAATRYSSSAKAQRLREAQLLQQEMRSEINRRRALAESQLQSLVEEVYAQRWPEP